LLHTAFRITSFWDCGILHSFYMTQPSYSLAFDKRDDVLPLNPLNTNGRLLYLKAFSFRAVNTFHLGYKNRTINDVSDTSRCLF
jgi:hypothetical protein